MYITRNSFGSQMTYLPQPIKLYKCWYCRQTLQNKYQYCSTLYGNQQINVPLKHCSLRRIKAGDTKVVLEILTTGNATQLNKDCTTHQKDEYCLLCLHRFVLVTERQSEDTARQWTLDGACLAQSNVATSTFMTYTFEATKIIFFLPFVSQNESSIRTYPEWN